MGRVKGNLQGVVKPPDSRHCREPVASPGAERGAERGAKGGNASWIPDRGDEVVADHIIRTLTCKEVNLS